MSNKKGDNEAQLALAAPTKHNLKWLNPNFVKKLEGWSEMREHSILRIIRSHSFIRNDSKKI